MSRSVDDGARTVRQPVCPPPLFLSLSSLFTEPIRRLVRRRAFRCIQLTYALLTQQRERGTRRGGGGCHGVGAMDLIYNDTGPSYDAGATNREASRGLALRPPRRARIRVHVSVRAIAIQRLYRSVLAFLANGPPLMLAGLPRRLHALLPVTLYAIDARDTGIFHFPRKTLLLFAVRGLRNAQWQL